MIRDKDLPTVLANSSNRDKKGQVAEQRTANVQRSRTVEVVQASEPHFSHFTPQKII